MSRNEQLAKRLYHATYCVSEMFTEEIVVAAITKALDRADLDGQRSMRDRAAQAMEDGLYPGDIRALPLEDP